MNISFEDSLAELLGGIQNNNPEVAEIIIDTTEKVNTNRQNMIEQSLLELVEEIELEDQIAAQETLLKLRDQRQRTTYRTNLINELNYYFAQAEQAGFIEGLTGIEIPLPELKLPLPTIDPPQFELGRIPKGLALPSLSASQASYAASEEDSSGYPALNGDEDFNRTVAGYIEELCQSEEGRRVWQETGVTSIFPASGINSYCHGTDLELNVGPLGFGVFCHELRHAWQYRQGQEFGPAAEREANVWASARCMELGHPLDALATSFMVIDPVTNLFYANYYSNSGSEEAEE